MSVVDTDMGCDGRVSLSGIAVGRAPTIRTPSRSRGRWPEPPEWPSRAIATATPPTIKVAVAFTTCRSRLHDAPYGAPGVNLNADTTISTGWPLLGTSVFQMLIRTGTGVEPMRRA